jgi:glycosyltransferase involved in cell wall biosynthesis
VLSSVRGPYIVGTSRSAGANTAIRAHEGVPRLKLFCLIAVRDEERYLPGFLHHIREHVDGIVALDDGSTDRTAEILGREKRVVALLREARGGPPHAHESANRHRLLVEAARLKARWVLCADADERLELGFLRRLRDEAKSGERTGQHIRCLKVVNLWNAPDLYRGDGLCGPRWAPRMFRIPDAFTARAAGMHQPWYPPELDRAPTAHMDAFLYHLRMIDRGERAARFAKFRSIDPDNTHQAIGYGHLIDETGLDLLPVLEARRYRDLAADGTPVEVFRDLTALAPPEALPPEALPDEAAFDGPYYLNENLDVRAAVAEGRVASAWAHFERQGAREKRPWRRRAGLRGFDFAAIVGDWRRAKEQAR